MKFFMYVPWGDDDRLIQSAAAYCERIDYRKGQYSSVELIDKTRLAEVDTGDMLYITGHGDSGDNNIYGCAGQKLTAGQLAGQFDGTLDTGHQTIKMWVCFSADGMTYKKGLAYSFWQEMRALGFGSLTVYGYRYVIMDPLTPKQKHTHAFRVKEGFKSVTETPELLEELPGTAQHWRTGIDPSGRIIPPKPLPRKKTQLTDEDALY